MLDGTECVGGDGGFGYATLLLKRLEVLALLLGGKRLRPIALQWGSGAFWSGSLVANLKSIKLEISQKFHQMGDSFVECTSVLDANGDGPGDQSGHTGDGNRK